MTDWPVAGLSPIQRLRVMAAGLRNAVVVERDFDVSADEVWQVASDLETTVPRIQSHVRSLEIVRSEGDELEVHVRGHAGLHATMQAVLQPRWCVMQSRFLVVVMAVDDTEDGARFARLQTVRVPGGRLLRPLVRRNLGDELGRLGDLL